MMGDWLNRLSRKLASSAGIPKCLDCDSLSAPGGTRCGTCEAEQARQGRVRGQWGNSPLGNMLAANTNVDKCQDCGAFYPKGGDCPCKKKQGLTGLAPSTQYVSPIGPTPPTPNTPQPTICTQCAGTFGGHGGIGVCSHCLAPKKGPPVCASCNRPFHGSGTVCQNCQTMGVPTCATCSGPLPMNGVCDNCYPTPNEDPVTFIENKTSEQIVVQMSDNESHKIEPDRGILIEGDPMVVKVYTVHYGGQAITMKDPYSVTAKKFKSKEAFLEWLEDE